jgi:hypothetical protein
MKKTTAMNLFKEKYDYIENRFDKEKLWEKFKNQLLKDKKISRYQWATWKSPYNK